VTPGPHLIGASPRRKDDQRLLVGAGRFLEDLARPGMLHLGVVRSAHAHARILKVETGQALGLPGVVAVWTAADLPEVGRPVMTGSAGVHQDRPFAVPVLARDVVRYVGEPLAVVVAESPYLLADTLDVVTAEYEPLTALVDPDEAMRSPVRIHDGWPDNVALHVRGAVGDPEAGFREAAVIISERFRHPRLAAVPIETRGVLAYRDAQSGLLTIWASVQSPYSQRDTIARILGLPAEEVRVLVPDVGGGFGPKGSVYPDEVLVAAAALRLGRPIRWVEGRAESFAAMGQDRDQRHEARVGFRQDGTIAAVEDRFLADVGAYPVQGSGLTANTVNHLPGPYRVPHYRNLGTSVVTHKTLNAAYRAAGRPEAVFVMERLMDLGARRLGLDPAEIRRRNLVRPEEMPYRPGLTYKDGVPMAYDPGDFPRAFERALTLLDYDGWRRRQRDAAAGERRIGVGLGCYAQGTGLGPFEGATVRVDPSGRIYVFIGVTAQGQGHGTSLAQIAADELGAALDDVQVVSGDTALFPYGMGTGGSRVAANAGPAVAKTAREVRGRAARVAAELLECAPEDIRFAESRAYVAGVRGRALPLARLAQAAVKSKALRGAVGEPGLNACTYFYPDTVTWAFGTHAAAVEVDVETGRTRLLRYAVVHDPGRAINPMIVEGQLHGGAAQGIAAGLLEEVRHDEHGQLLSGSLMDYALPRADDLPWIDVALDEHRSVVNPLGIKGVGESGCIPAAAVIANAVEDALADRGIVIREVPVTAVRLVAALVQPA
jgi:carbon-monoxide dehydrogenase large subunit